MLSRSRSEHLQLKNERRKQKGKIICIISPILKRDAISLPSLLILCSLGLISAAKDFSFVPLCVLNQKKNSSRRKIGFNVCLCANLSSQSASADDPKVFSKRKMILVKLQYLVCQQAYLYYVKAKIEENKSLKGRKKFTNLSSIL